MTRVMARSYNLLHHKTFQYTVMLQQLPEGDKEETWQDWVYRQYNCSVRSILIKLLEHAQSDTWPKNLLIAWMMNLEHQVSSRNWIWSRADHHHANVHENSSNYIYIYIFILLPFVWWAISSLYLKSTCISRLSHTTRKCNRIADDHYLRYAWSFILARSSKGERNRVL
jgi:hypothetical protein